MCGCDGAGLYSPQHTVLSDPAVILVLTLKTISLWCFRKESVLGFNFLIFCSLLGPFCCYILKSVFVDYYGYNEEVRILSLKRAIWKWCLVPEGPPQVSNHGAIFSLLWIDDR